MDGFSVASEPGWWVDSFPLREEKLSSRALKDIEYALQYDICRGPRFWWPPNE